MLSAGALPVQGGAWHAHCRQAAVSASRIGERLEHDVHVDRIFCSGCSQACSQAGSRCNAGSQAGPAHAACDNDPQDSQDMAATTCEGGMCRRLTVVGLNAGATPLRTVRQRGSEVAEESRLGVGSGAVVCMQASTCACCQTVSSPQACKVGLPEHKCIADLTASKRLWNFSLGRSKSSASAAHLMACLQAESRGGDPCTAGMQHLAMQATACSHLPGRRSTSATSPGSDVSSNCARAATQVGDACMHAERCLLSSRGGCAGSRCW